jgi:hypothetical protein
MIERRCSFLVVIHEAGTLPKVEAHLVAEHRARAGPGPVKDGRPLFVSGGNEPGNVLAPRLLHTRGVVQIELSIDDGPLVRFPLHKPALGHAIGAIAAILRRIRFRIGFELLQVFRAGELPCCAFPFSRKFRLALHRLSLGEVRNNIMACRALALDQSGEDFRLAGSGRRNHGGGNRCSDGSSGKQAAGQHGGIPHSCCGLRETGGHALVCLKEPYMAGRYRQHTSNYAHSTCRDPLFRHCELLYSACWCSHRLWQ